MAIQVKHSASVRADETVRTNVPGPASASVAHDISSKIEGDMTDVWSAVVAVPMGAPVDLDLQALETEIGGVTLYKNLTTGQQIRICRIRNTGAGFVNVTVKKASDELLLLPLGPDGDFYFAIADGHLFAQEPDTISLLALTGESDLEMLIASK